jgi:Domain of unknown function (DUF5658)
MLAQAFVLSLALTAPTDDSAEISLRPLADAATVAMVPSTELPSHGGAAVETSRWMRDRSSRPGALLGLYASLGVLQGLDLYSTRRAVDAGAHELNPVVGKAARNTGAMLALKALSTAGSIYFTERAWKKNRKGAVVLMAIVNGVTAAVVANNLKNVK